MQTQISTNQSPFSPFFGSVLKFETPNVDPPDGGGGSGGSGGSGAPTTPPPDEDEEPQQ